eukprot:scaffold7544_cov107-Isochrysis_galbana.AAC.15
MSCAGAEQRSEGGRVGTKGETRRRDSVGRRAAGVDLGLRRRTEEGQSGGVKPRHKASARSFRMGRGG